MQGKNTKDVDSSAKDDKEIEVVNRLNNTESRAIEKEDAESRGNELESAESREGSRRDRRSRKRHHFSEARETSREYHVDDKKFPLPRERHERRDKRSLWTDRRRNARDTQDNARRAFHADEHYPSWKEEEKEDSEPYTDSNEERREGNDNFYENDRRYHEGYSNRWSETCTNYYNKRYRFDSDYVWRKME